MDATLFNDVRYPLSKLIADIDAGEIGLPDIQRPFVWNNTKVRDLFDSMFQGFPVGYFLFWSNVDATGARKIGTGEKQAVPRLMIVDGQQRLTSLYAVLKGCPVIDDNYKESRIRIAFRPRDQRFAVADAAVERDPEFIPDISQLWIGQDGRHKFIKTFLARVSAARDLSDEEEDKLVEAISRLDQLQNYPCSAVELASSLDEEQVAEVFVRINSKGVTLNQADFILTLMSVWWEKGRKALEEFSRMSRTPSVAGPSPYNHFIEPDPDQLLRVAVGLGFRRGRLRAVYAVLRGRDMESGQYSADRRDEQFAVLKDAQAYALDLTNWHEFMKCLVRAGFRSSKMISSKNALLYTYLIFLVGKRDFKVDPATLRDLVARWFFMVSLTGRYTSSPETRVEADLARLRGIGTAREFVDLLDQQIEDVLTEDFWRITLPNDLESSAGFGPTLFGYYAALNLLDAKVLFSKMRVNQLMDPALNAKKAPIDRHHLFPRAYLKSMGVADVRDINQMANMALLEWPENIEIADQPPAEYFPKLIEGSGEAELREMRFWHALPSDWETMEYRPFLEQRRILLAEVVRAAFERLRIGEGEVSEEQESLAELIESGESKAIEFKATARWNQHTQEQDPRIEHAIMKTVAGFANAQGGMLLVGVADDGTIIGLKNDLKLVKKQDRDGFELWLMDYLKVCLGGPAAARVSADFPAVDGKHVCRIRIPKAPEPVFANPPGGEKAAEFFVRIGNSTRKLPTDEVLQYTNERWG